MKQFIPTNAITQLVDRPEVSVLQNSGHTAWAEVQEGGGLLLGGIEPRYQWLVFQDSGSSRSE